MSSPNSNKSTAQAVEQEQAGPGILASLASNARQYGIVGALVVIVIVFEILTKGVLLKPNSFVSLIQQNAYVIILAIGMVMVIIATHIDLSVGSLVTGSIRSARVSSPATWSAGTSRRNI